MINKVGEHIDSQKTQAQDSIECNILRLIVHNWSSGTSGLPGHFWTGS